MDATAERIKLLQILQEVRSNSQNSQPVNWQPIPVQLSEPEFTAFILPYLSMPKRGPKCKLGYYRVFNLILWVLYTGMQWKCLPVPTDPMGNRPFTTRPSTKSLPNGPMTGHSGRRSSPACGIWRPRNSSIPACSMATGPTPWPKKGGWHWVLGAQTPEGREGHCHHRQSWLRLSACPRGSCQ